jgi:hypothetical protein
MIIDQILWVEIDEASGAIFLIVTTLARPSLTLSPLKSIHRSNNVVISNKKSSGKRTLSPPIFLSPRIALRQPKASNQGRGILCT